MYAGHVCRTDVPGSAVSQQLNPSHVLAHLLTPSSIGLSCPSIISADVVLRLS